MKEKIKKIFKNRIFICILTAVVASTVSVYAVTYFPSNQVTYDNKTSGLSSTDVQGAIDELYNTCFPPTAGDQIINDNELEKDLYECRYFFTGANPNNYITFNDEEAGWRIISIECDGRIKIIKEANINKNNLAWDRSNSNNWRRPATLNTYLNSTYYNSLTNVARSQVVSSNFSVGEVIENNNDLGIQVSDENGTTWKGNIALSTLSEYLRTNSNKSSCGTYSLMSTNYSSCIKTGWMDKANVDYWWTLSPVYDYEYALFAVWDDGNIGYIEAGETVYTGIYPTLYLSSDIQITGGDGSQNNPYVLK